MFAVLALLFVVAELYVIVQVAAAIGVLNTIALLIVVSMAGVWLAKRQGFHLFRRMQATVAEGKVPSAEIVDGVLILLAGVLMVVPGFLSAGLALLLLLPPIRALARRSLLRRIRAGGGFVGVIPGGAPGPGAASDVWDVEGWEDPSGPPPTPPSLGP
jgi:UPF0716 protein FxsA